jgi:hypothetical protein
VGGWGWPNADKVVGWEWPNADVRKIIKGKTFFFASTEKNFKVKFFFQVTDFFSLKN